MPETPFYRIHGPAAAGQWLLRELSCREGLSQIAEYELCVSSGDEALSAQDYLGQTLTIVLGATPGRERVIQGGITAFSALEGVERRACYGISLRPWLWQLTLSRRHRIFQDKSLRQVLEALFEGYPATVDWRFGDDPAPLYRVQFGESDFSFFSRLLEEAGLYYYFEQQGEQQRLVIVESMNDHPRVAHFAQMRYDPNLASSLGHIHRWTHRQAWVPAAVSLGDYDFRKANSREASVLAATYAQPARHAQAGQVQERFPGLFSCTGSGEARARVQLEALQASQETASGHAGSPYLVPGHCFSLDEHPQEAFNGDYLIVRADLHVSGSGPTRTGAFQCEFEAIPCRGVFRAAQSTPRPIIAGPQTALVVSAPGLASWVDEFGQVKVRFHWDRQDDGCSCWVRVAQPLAGKNWGAMFLPRVGQEVVVEFLEGNPERPLVTGSLYNSGHMPPWKLPEQAARYGFKSPGTEGRHDELSFDERAGSEQVRLLARRSLQLQAGERLLLKVGASSLVLSAAGIAINGRALTLDATTTVDINGGATSAADSPGEADHGQG